jgi:hypothetical protein
MNNKNLKARVLAAFEPGDELLVSEVAGRVYGADIGFKDTYMRTLLAQLVSEGKLMRRSVVLDHGSGYEGPGGGPPFSAYRLP